MEDIQPRIALETTPEGVCAVLRGRWTAGNVARFKHWTQLQTQLRRALAASPAVWDFRMIERLDHTGAQILWNAWGRSWPAHLQVLDAQRAILHRVARFSMVPPATQAVTPWTAFLTLGAKVMGVLWHLRGVLQLLGQLALDLLRLLRAPAKGPWRDVSGHVYRIGALALPITATVGFAIGVVLAYLMSKQLRLYGADTFIVNILGLAVTREMGPVLAAILIAGRSGSAITAQIGVMRVTEELDAMRVMGIAKGYRLVMPRVLATVFAMPLVAVWTTAAALVGGVLAADVSLGLTPAYFLDAMPKAVSISNLWLSIGKSMVFGLEIAVIACYFGLRVQPNTQSLGQGTTASVVTSITVVLLTNALFAIVFKDVGI